MKMPTRLILVAACAMAATAQAQLKPPATPKAATPAAAPAPAPAAAASAPAEVAPPANPEMENAGRLAAHAWLLLLDRRDWGTAWEASSGMFRQSVPLGSWMDAIPKVREPFGALVEREPGNAMYKTTLSGRPDGHYVSVIFNGRFDKKPNVQEVVTTVREADGRWRVTGYTFSER